jgi:hypothetical protein
VSSEKFLKKFRKIKVKNRSGRYIKLQGTDASADYIFTYCHRNTCRDLFYKMELILSMFTKTTITGQQKWQETAMNAPVHGIVNVNPEQDIDTTSS